MSIIKSSPLFLLLACGGLKTATDTGGEGVVAVDVLGILITPDEVIVPVGGSIQMEAKGLNDARESVDLTDAVRWETGSGSVATISNDTDDEGVLRGVAAGVTSIYADFEDVRSAPARITITDAALNRLAITPAGVTLGVGESVKLSAEATFSDGSSSDASSQVRWVTESGAIATLDDKGLVTGQSLGSTHVHVEWDGVQSDPIEVTVGAGSGGDVDLVVSSLAGVVSDGVVTITVGIENKGTSSAGGFWIDYWVDPPSQPTYGDWPDAFKDVSYVGPSELVFVSYEMEVSGTDHVVAVLLDSMNFIEETNEDNNLGGAETTTTSGGGTGSELPNLRISFFDAYPDVETELTEYWIDVHNTGAADATAFYVDLFHDTAAEPSIGSTGDAYELVSELPAGATAYLALYGPFCDECTSWVLVDSFDLIDESDEGDNTEECWVEAFYDD